MASPEHGLSDIEGRLRRVVAANLRRLLVANDMSIGALAGAAGVSRSQLFNVLGLHQSPTIDWLAKVAGALGVEVSQLLTRTDRHPRSRTA